MGQFDFDSMDRINSRETMKQYEIYRGTSQDLSVSGQYGAAFDSFFTSLALLIAAVICFLGMIMVFS